MRATLAAVATGAVLLMPISVAAGAPVANKSGAVVNYTSVKKVKIARKMKMHFVCAVDCSVTARAKIKGPGAQVKFRPLSGSFAANQPLFLELTISKRFVRIIRSAPGKFRIVNAITATDAATGAVDHIKHSFKLKR
jgi:hypothetical protein